MIFNTHVDGGAISDCNKYRIIKGYNNIYEIYMYDSKLEEYYLYAERKTYTQAIKYCNDLKKLEKIFKNEL